MRKRRTGSLIFALALTAAGVFSSPEQTWAADGGDGWKFAAADSFKRAESSPESRQLPFVQGLSYYNRQWALNNNGNLRRVSWEPQMISEEFTSNPDSSSVLHRRYQWGEQVTNSLAGIDIRAEEAWQVYEQLPERRQVTVAIIDSGVDINHPDLAGAIWVNTDEIPGDGLDNDGNGYVDDDNGWNFYENNNQVTAEPGENHGTHGAGTIAGAWDGQGITGIADGNYVKLMILKVLNSQEGQGVAENVKAAIRYARDNGADICNISMGTSDYDPELEALIAESPMLFVVSAGNGDWTGRGSDIDQNPIYPAAYPCENIISVANLMFDGSLDETSNYGAVGVDIAAPGTYILSTIPEGYAYLSGTSMSAPMVTGTAALVYSARTDLDLMGVKQAILNSAVPLEGLAGRMVSGGMLNAYGAINYGR